MRKLILGIITLSIATLSYAALSNPGNSTSTLRALGAAWKAQQTTELKPGHDINIVYGGEDVSNKPSLNTTTAIA